MLNIFCPKLSLKRISKSLDELEIQNKIVECPCNCNPFKIFSTVTYAVYNEEDFWKERSHISCSMKFTTLITY